MDMGGGLFEVHDYKTNMTLARQEELDQDRQLAMYSLWVREQFSDFKKVRLVWHFVAFDKEIGRGTRDTFAELVLGDGEAPAPGTASALGANEAVITAVAEVPGAVSILSIGHQTEDVVGLAIVGAAGQAVEPTAENVPFRWYRAQNGADSGGDRWFGECPQVSV